VIGNLGGGEKSSQTGPRRKKRQKKKSAGPNESESKTADGECRRRVESGGLGKGLTRNCNSLAFGEKR